MPIFYQQDIDPCTRLAVWKIEEPEEFFSALVPLQRDITHPHKRLQHLAGRFLLRELFPDFPLDLIKVADTRKPFLEDEAYHFSISHCSDYAAVIVSKENRVGVDLEIVSEKVERIRHKFISEAEEAVLRHPFLIPVLPGQPGVLSYADTALQSESGRTEFVVGPSEVLLSTLVWSCKEAVFKWYGSGQVDFKGHIQLRSVIDTNGEGYETVVLFTKAGELFLNLQSKIFGNICLSYVVT